MRTNCLFQRYWVFLILLVLAWSGCKAPAPTPAELDAGAIWMFPGIFGGDEYLGEVRRAFRDAGVEEAIYSYDWGRIPVLDSFTNLMDEEGNRQAAAAAAEQIVTYARSHPNRPIDLVGYSGGGGMVVMVAEALPEEVHLRNMALVHGAVSPDYDLTVCLRHVNGRLINFHSHLDWLILGLGTSLFGTMDREYVEAAGKDGFHLETAVPDPVLREKVVQVPWTQESLKSLHLGNHTSMLFYTWNKNFVAPWFLPEAPDAGLSVSRRFQVESFQQ